MRYQTMNTQVRKLIAAEGYLELGLPERAVRELDAMDHPELLKPYANFLLGQAYRQLERYEEAINPLHEAARTIPPPLNRRAWRDLGDCFRREGHEELADIVDMFAEEAGDEADQDPGQGGFAGMDFEDHGDRSWPFPWDDFAQYNFEADGSEAITKHAAHRQRRQK